MVLKTIKILKRKRIFSSYCLCLNQYYSKLYVFGRNRGAHTICTRSWKVMFFGTDDFSLGCLTRLHEEMKIGKTISKLEIVSSKYHLNPVRLFGQGNNLIVHEWPLEPQAIVDFDIGFVASFGHLIPKKIIDAFPLGMINVHGSLLPRWRGAAPVNYAIMHGDSVTGVSMMCIKPHSFDKGDVLSRRQISISPTETALQLRARLSEIGGEELIACLRQLPQCLQNASPQPQEGVSYAPRITPELGILNFQKMSAKCIFNRYRALCGIVPLSATWMGLTFSLHDVSVGSFSNNSSKKTDTISRTEMTSCDELLQQAKSSDFTPGQVLFDKKAKVLAVVCKDKSCLIVGRIAPFKRKALSAVEFYNGYLSKKDKIDWFFV